MADPISDLNELWPSDPGWTRGEILPLEWQGDAQGRRKPGGAIRLATPDALRQMANDLYYTFTTPAKVLTGQETNPDAMRMAATLTGVGMGVPKPAGSLGIFGGQKAVAANRDMLARAWSLESRGSSPEEIWNQTGWFKGPDQRWRFEIPDESAQWKGPVLPSASGKDVIGGFSGNETLGSVLHHPELFEQYPQLRDLKVSGLSDQALERGTTAQFDSTAGAVHLGPEPVRSVVPTLLHEIQHGVQKEEDFSVGGSSELFFPQRQKAEERLQGARNDLRTLLKETGHDPDHIFAAAVIKHKLGIDLPEFQELDPEFQRVILDNVKLTDQIRDRQNEAYKLYHRLAGEVEARTVEERYSQGDRLTPPWKTEGIDVPPEKQILRKSGQRPQLKVESVDHNPFSHTVVPVVHNPFEHALEPVEHDPFATEETSP